MNDEVWQLILMVLFFLTVLYFIGCAEPRQDTVRWQIIQERMITPW